MEAAEEWVVAAALETQLHFEVELGCPGVVMAD